MATDTIAHVKLSHVILPLKTEISDAKVFTGRQKPMTEVNFLFCELETTEGRTGLGFGYSSRPISSARESGLMAASANRLARSTVAAVASGGRSSSQSVSRQPRAGMRSCGHRAGAGRSHNR